MSSDISELTRSIYESQHERYINDEDSFSRLYNMYENSSLPISKDWFKEKIALDAGCGNAGPFILWLLHQGISEVYGIDLGIKWKNKLQTFLASKGISESQLKLKSGNVLNIPYEYFLGGIDMIADDTISYVKKDILVFGISVTVFLILVLFFIRLKILFSN